MSSFINIVVELKKCCNHPTLVKKIAGQPELAVSFVHSFTHFFLGGGGDGGGRVVD